MATISLNPTLYRQAQTYAKADGLSVEDWVSMLITRFAPAKKKKYEMRKIEELSPELQALIGFAKPAVANDDDINGDKARMEYLNAKTDALGSDMPDFEDMLQYKAAVSAECDVIVTRDKKRHFPINGIPVLSPEDFLNDFFGN